MTLSNYSAAHSSADKFNQNWSAGGSNFSSYVDELKYLDDASDEIANAYNAGKYNMVIPVHRYESISSSMNSSMNAAVDTAKNAGAPITAISISNYLKDTLTSTTYGYIAEVSGTDDLAYLTVDWSNINISTCTVKVSYASGVVSISVTEPSGDVVSEDCYTVDYYESTGKIKLAETPTSATPGTFKVQVTGITDKGYSGTSSMQTLTIS